MSSGGSLKIGTKLSLALILTLLLAVFATGGGSERAFAEDDTIGSLLERLNDKDSGQVESGKLVYINDGKELGSENYVIRKKKDGGLALNSEGVVTPPIPIPFVKPKIKFNQTIHLDNNLEPVSLSLQYKGPLGIGSKKITATVNDNFLEIKRGKKEKSLELTEGRYFFTGTTSSGALFAIVIAREGAISNLTEILSGGTGPRGGNEDKVLSKVVFETSQTRTMKVDGKATEVTGYTYREEETGRKRELIMRGGSLIAYRAKSEDSSFYAFREDLLGKGFRF